jgi:hypothetical protein
MANFTVHRNRRYRATLRLGLLEQLAANDIVAEALHEAGFTDVSVEGSGATRFAEATWPLEDASAPLPSQVVSVSEVEDA